MFGRAGKVKRAVEKSLSAALDGAGEASFAPIEKLRDGEKVDAYVDLCHGLIFEEDLAAAEAAIDKALELAPEELYVLDAKAEVATEDGRHGDALAIYQKMHEIDPDDPAVIAGLGELLLKGDDAAAAVELLEPHAESPHPSVQQRYAEALLVSGRAAEALEVVDQVHAYCIARLKQASFVDNVQELKSSFEEVSRLRDEIIAHLAEQGHSRDID